jgi:hypothetical protein
MAQALSILTEFVKPGYVLPETTREKCEITKIVNEALRQLSTEDSSAKSLIDRVQKKREELLNPQQILNEVAALSDIEPLDPSIEKVVCDYILSGKALLNETHLKLVTNLLGSPLYSSSAIPQDLFLEKILLALELADLELSKASFLDFP